MNMPKITVSVSNTPPIFDGFVSTMFICDGSRGAMRRTTPRDRAKLLTSGANSRQVLGNAIHVERKKSRLRAALYVRLRIAGHAHGRPPSESGGMKFDGNFPGSASIGLVEHLSRPLRGSAKQGLASPAHVI